MTTHEAGQDARVETVARAMFESDGFYRHDWPGVLATIRDLYRRRAVAALAAMHPADETLRELLVWLAAEGYEVKADDTDGPGLTPTEVLDRYRAVLGGVS